MPSYFVTESGRLIEAAKRAAFDAVEGYANVTPYTIGVAVQAAAAILQAGASGFVDPVPQPVARREVIDVGAIEVTPRLRALESVARAAFATHAPHTGPSDCLLCAALAQLDELEAAG